MIGPSAIDRSRKVFLIVAVGGLALTLMRSGYLTLRLNDWTNERLRAADAVISIAPSSASMLVITGTLYIYP